MNTLKFNQIQFNHIGEQLTSSIKLQEKSVTIKENGTTEVVPDSGYALGKVEVKTDIESLGIKYYKTTPEFLDKWFPNYSHNEVYLFASVVCYIFNTTRIIITPYVYCDFKQAGDISLQEISAFQINFNQKETYIDLDKQIITYHTIKELSQIPEWEHYDFFQDIISLEEISESEYFVPYQ